ncbi:L-2-amino-thiazoline-4-carboxylic acid hydrolase [Synechococcus sp. RSCCF101]|uniref:L-2-amino-thiazoline-4-carboxylic acid hydrolase n=1 Tax=Synechococcus sp. RSCCF101 TaxID=2511069 RepID=UPI00177BBBF6|nr:L-2-amino-thiazoline-4-carboxylic acid hydrolase [Synechococcus sp. RSCCF101]
MGTETWRQRTLLRDFDRTAWLLRADLVQRYGERDAERLARHARVRCMEILGSVSWVKGRGAAVMNGFLWISAQELALFQAIEARGGDAAEAWAICHKAIRLRVERIPGWKRWLMRRLLFSALVRRIIRRRAVRGDIVRAGDFKTRSLIGDGIAFDLGVDYLRCGNLELARTIGAETFAPYLCLSDIALSEGLGWGLIRTQTLADGCSHCDFRFKQGGPTRIKSRTPEVQATLERIARTEAELAATAQSLR